MVLRAFGYAARPKFFDTLADDCLVKYTPFASGGSTNGGVQAQWQRDGKEIVLHCARWPAHGRRHSHRFHPTDNRGRLTGSAVRHARGRIFYPIPTNQQYDVSPDVQRFLMNTIIDEVSSPITVILKLVPNTSPIARQHCLRRVHASAGQALKDQLNERYRD